MTPDFLFLLNMKTAIRLNSQLVFSGHALGRMRRGGESLLPHEVHDLVFFNRSVLAGRGHDGSDKFYLWNSLRNTNMVAILADDLCCVTCHPGRPLQHKKNEPIVHLSVFPHYLPMFNGPVSHRVRVSVVAQCRCAEHLQRPDIILGTRHIKIHKANRLWQLLLNRTLRGPVHDICHCELDGLVPLGIQIDGVRLPLSAILDRKDHDGRIIVPWSFKPLS